MNLFEFNEYVPCCIRCGERLKGVTAFTATLCGLCADDELNDQKRDRTASEVRLVAQEANRSLVEKIKELNKL